MPDERPTLLAVLVSDDERTQDEIVAGFEQCAREHGEDATLSLRTLRRWILGDVRTLPRPAQRRVARLYWGRSMDELLAPAPPGTTGLDHDDDTGARGAAAVRSGRPVEPATSGTTVPDALAVRTASPAARDTTLERQVAMSTRRATRFTTYAETRNAGPEAVAQLATEVGVLAGDYIREPLMSIMGDLIEAQDTVFNLLEGKQHPNETVDLYMLASIVSALLAKASHDLGRPHDAMTQARAMYVCADNADHLSLQAWARGLQSLIAYWDGRTQEAIRHAEAGEMIAGNLRGSVTVWLPALEARAWAQLGNAAEARAAVERARNRRDTMIPDDLDNIGGLLAFPEAKQHYYAAGALVFVEGGGDDAEAEALTALDLYQAGDELERSFSDIAGSRAELALARVQRDELEGAREALDPMLELNPDRRIGGIIASADRIHVALSSTRFADSPEARDLRDEIESFCHIPASALRR